MQYIHLALALHSAGKEITVDNITKMLKAVGVEADAAQIKALIAVLGDVDIEEAIKSAPVGMAAAAPVASGGGGGAAAPAQEEPEEEEEEGDDMGLDSLFG